MELSTHPSSDGSATVSQGLTKVSVAVFGPREPKQRAGSSSERGSVSVEVGVVPWAQAGQMKRTRGDKWVKFLLVCRCFH